MRALAAASIAASLALTGCAASLAPTPIPPASAPSAAKKVADEAAASIPGAQDLADMERRLFEHRSVRGSPSVRAPVDPEPFSPNDLPLLTVPEPLQPLTAPVAVTGMDTTELSFDGFGVAPPTAKRTDKVSSVRVAVVGPVIGRIRIGSVEGSAASGVTVPCGGPGGSLRSVLPARWETLSPTDKGGATFEIVNAWFDTVACQATVVERASVLAVPLLGRVVYGIRQRPASGDQAEVVTLIGPRYTHIVTAAVGGEATSQAGAFARVTLPLRRGAGASMLGKIGANALSGWAEIMGPTGFPSSDLLVGVEIAQSVEDSTPVAIAYAGVPRLLPLEKSENAEITPGNDPFAKR